MLYLTECNYANAVLGMIDALQPLDDVGHNGFCLLLVRTASTLVVYAIHMAILYLCGLVVNRWECNQFAVVIFIIREGYQRFVF